MLYSLPRRHFTSKVSSKLFWVKKLNLIVTVVIVAHADFSSMRNRRYNFGELLNRNLRYFIETIVCVAVANWKVLAILAFL
jgi:hypothetical protein